MKCYIASSFDEAHVCEAVAKMLKSKGIEVPDIWWNVKTKDDFTTRDDLQFYGSPLVQSIAARHWRTLRDVDFVILVSNLEKERSFTGANVEIGYALALNKPVLALGKLKRSAMYVPVIRCVDFIELMQAIDCINLAKR